MVESQSDLRVVVPARTNFSEFVASVTDERELLQNLLLQGVSCCCLKLGAAPRLQLSQPQPQLSPSQLQL